MSIAPLKIYNIIDDPFAKFLPENIAYCLRPEINELHRETCAHLGISEIYPEILWTFSNKLIRCMAEAVYWKDSTGKMQWRIHYDTRFWVSMGAEGRKNTIIHEVCHLAVEKLYGHRPKSKNQEAITDHGSHWQELMHKCKEDPFMPNPRRYR